LADHLLAIGDHEGGDAAHARYIQCSTKEPILLQAAAAMVTNDIPQAERLLKGYLKRQPTDTRAIRMLAEVAVRCGRNEDARKLLERCLELAPGFAACSPQLRRPAAPASTTRSGRSRKSSDCSKANPRNPSYRNLCAVLLSRIGEYERSARIYAQLLEEYPAHAKVWLSYGHVLKTEGRQQESIDAYRRSIVQDPAFGEAYWSLANLKTFRFSPSDLSAMQAQLARPELEADNRLQLHFALGKAFEDSGDYARSFEHYAQGNALHRAAHPYDAELNSRRVARLRQTFTAEFFRERAGSGCDAADPIFIVGMPRAGSTLLEQILSSHSAVEGTTELPEVITMAKELRSRANSDDIAVYAEVLAARSADELRKWASATSSARASIARPTDRSSSTRCRTTSCTSA
jgi:tetratricopeptide (TPR) repeat protein